MNPTRGLIAGVAVVVAGCAGHVDTDPTENQASAYDETASTTARNGTTAESPLAAVATNAPSGDFVTLGPCVDQQALACVGGYRVQEVNSTEPARLVASIDVSAIGSDAIGQANGGGDALIFQGRFQPIGRYTHALVFVASAVWRGLPGVAPPADDAISMISTTNGVLFANPVNLSTEIAIDAVNVSGFAPSMVDTAWLTSRVLQHGALVAGAIHDGTFDASQVFVSLPAVTGPCEDPLLHCGDEVPTFTPNANLCMVSTGCVVPRPCPEDRPVCDPGYVLAAWPSLPDGCNAFACDPAFLTQ